MKRPGDTGRQGTDIESLEVDPDLTMEDAIQHARQLGADAEYDPDHDDGYAYVPPGFVTSALDFTPGEVFLVEDRDGDETLYEVASDRNFTPELGVRRPGAQPRDPEYESTAWDEFGTGYATLWLAWLQGRVVPVETETTYVRSDTGEPV